MAPAVDPVKELPEMRSWQEQMRFLIVLGPLLVALAWGQCVRMLFQGKWLRAPLKLFQ